MRQPLKLGSKGQYLDAVPDIFIYGDIIMTEIIIAIITSLFTFAGVVITVMAGNKRTEKNLKEQSQLTLYRIEQLEKKQDQHNNLIIRMYEVEKRLDVIDERVKVENHRIDDLEHTAG